MNYKGVLIAVTDMEKSKRFYHDLLELEVVDDFGANVVLTGGLFLQTAATWKDFIRKEKDEIILKNNACELYFETDGMDSFVEKLDAYGGVAYVHPLVEHRWGQRAVRFYDPNGHIIEVGENINMVVKRFVESGLSVEEATIRMDVSIDYIKAALR